MFLKELQMAGFKSFAHPMRLELGPGVTAVVGPNGSGKSNIVDAVRWVLGEQSARVLRGAKGEDVIFGGSAARHALGMAEVTLVLDNADGRVSLDVAEVAIARRLYRSGETDYLLNRRRARLRDVLDIAGQAGLGPDSYCVVGQGAIEQLAMQRPQERRTLIADAADIRRHEARLAEIESDLLQTQQNALRVAAVVAEVRPQLDRLRSQAERAERHRRVRDEVEALAQAWYGRSLPAARLRMEAAERHRRVLQVDISAARDRLTAAERRRSELHGVGASLRAQADALAAALGPAREHREGLRVERATAAQRQESLAVRLDEVKAELDAVKEQAQAAEQAVAASEEALGAAPAGSQPATSAEEASLAEADAVLATARQHHRDAQRQLEDARRRLEGAERELAHLEAAREATRVAEAARAARRAESETRLAELEAQIAEAEQQLAAEQQEAHASARRLEEARLSRERLRAALRAAEAEGSAATRTLDGLLGEERALASLAADPPPSLTLPGKGGGDSPSASPSTGEGAQSVLLPLLTSALGSLLSGPLRYQLAIAAALGAAARFRVVDADDTAWSVDADATAADGNVLVAARHRQRGELARFRAWVDDALAGHVAYRFAVDLLQGSADAGLVELYLGNTIITAGLPDARVAADRLAKRAGPPMFQVATEDGRCLRWNGEHVLGPELPEARAIEVRVRQAALAEGIAVARAAAAAAEHALAEARAAEHEAAGAVRSCEESWRGITARVRGQEEALGRLRTEAQRERARAQAGEAPAAEPRRVAISTSLEALSARRQTLLTDVQRAEAALQGEEQELTTAEAASVAALDVRLAGAARAAVAAERLARLRDAVERDNRELDRLRQREAGLQGEAARLDAELVALTERGAALAGGLAAVEEAMQALEAQHHDNAAALARHEEATERVIAEQGAVQAELADLRTDEATAGAAVESAGGRLERLEVELSSLAENLAKTPEELLRGRAPGGAPGLGELDEEALERRLARALRDLRNVGGVDYGVLAEYGALKDRYGYLTEQLDDLNRAEVQIRDGMGEARERMRDQFSTVFEEVNGRFQDMFRGLFGGGDAELLLVGDAGSPQCGVDIVAQPPGKRLHRLATLSGGERALVGAALLLALIGANPSPFCMLDEVDAALDDANVSRFAGTIRDMAERTQFILVTHNRATMEMADALYGVTMTPGAVSQVLAIRLPD